MGNRIALITGATSGIGAAFAKKYASMGYDLIITGRRVDKINQLAEKIKEKNGVKVEVIITELSNKNDISALVEKIKDKDINALVNNAGFGYNSLFCEGDLKVFEDMIGVNVLLQINLIRAVLPGMIKRSNGSIINVSSEGAFLMFPKNAVYSGVKSFTKSFTESLYLELIGTGVKIQSLCPGLTKTDFHEKMGMNKARQVNRGIIKWMSPDEVVDCSIKDLSKDKVICIPGIHEKVLIKMLNILPRPVYNKLACNLFKK